MFDALTSKRPYKDAYPVDTSFRTIAGLRGTHFDPCIVDAFFAVKEQILAIKEKYKDNFESLLFTKSAVFKKPENLVTDN